MALDQQISQVVYRAKLIERAYYERGPWYLQFDLSICPADRKITEDSIIFLATAPHDFDQVSLYCGDDLVAIRSIDGEAMDVVEWVMSLAPVSITPR